MTRLLRYASGVTILAGVCVGAHAQNLRCGNSFAEPGDAKLSVIEKCGEPALKDSFCKPPPANETQTTTQGTVLKMRPCDKIEEWSYKPGSGQFITILQFEQGTLTKIRYGNRIP